MKRKIIFALSLAAMLGFGSLTTLTSCDSSTVTSEKHQVTVTEGEGFTVSGLKEEGYSYGETVTFNINVSDSTKTVDEVKAGDTKLTPTSDSGYAFKIGNEDVTITVSLKTKGTEVETATITIKEGISNGSVTLSRIGEVKVGETIEIIAIPNDGYEVDKYYLDNTELSSNTFVVTSGTHEVNVTFKVLDPSIIYGSVVVQEESVTNGTIVAKLEDGTILKEENRRQPVGTKILLEVTPQDECYKVNEVKLNDTVLSPEGDAYSFTVQEGKNYISGSFTLTNPGQGLIRLSADPEHATVEIDKLDEYVAVGETITIKVTPDANFTVKSVLLNDQPIIESNEENVFTFEVIEGLNRITIEVTSSAEGIEFIIPDDWVKTDSTYRESYYIVVGQEYQIQTRFTPEGSYDDLIYEVTIGDDAYIEVTQEGVVKGKEIYGSDVGIKVSLKSNPDTYEIIYFRVVSKNELSIETLKNSLKASIESEKKNTNKTQLVVETKAMEETSSSKTTYDFEVYNDNHSVTTVTNEKGDTSRYYRTIFEDTFYSLYRNGSETKVPDNGDTTKITSDNREEYETMVNTFGGIEFSLTEGQYSGVTDFLYQKVFGDGSVYDEDDDYDPFASSTIVTSTFGNEWDIVTKIKGTDWLGDPYAFDIHLYFNFDLYGDLQSATYERKDYKGLTEENTEVTSETPYDFEKYEISLTYGEKGSDQNNYFDINDYFFTDFKPEVYLSRDFTEESKVQADNEGKYNVSVDDTVYISINDAMPNEAMQDIDKIETSSEGDTIGAISTTSSGGFYFDVIGEGETTITLKSKNVTKEITIKSTYKPVESVSFDESVADTMLVGNSLLLSASVTPSEGIRNDEVKFDVIEDTTGGAYIDERPGRYGYGTDYYLISGPNAGTVKVKAISLDNENISAEKTIEVKEVPSVLSNIAGKTYSTSWSDYGYDTTSYDFKISFGGDINNMTAEVSFTITTEPYWGDTTVTNGTFSADVKQNLSFIVLSNLQKTSGNMEATEVPTSLTINLNDNFEFDKLSINDDGDSHDLIEFVDITDLINGNTYGLSWSDYYSDYSMKMTFDNSSGSMKVSIDYTLSGYSTQTGKFTADVTIGASSINLSNLTQVEGDEISEYDYPPTEIDYKVNNGEVTFTYEGGGWYE